MEIKYSDIFSKCEELSAYESKRAVDANGESMFSSVHMISQDMDLLIHYSKDCASIIDKVLRFVIKDTNYKTTGIDFIWVQDSTDSGIQASNLEDDLTQILADYVFAQYLSNILPDRANFWAGNAKSLLDLLPRKFTRSKPTQLDPDY